MNKKNILVALLLSVSFACYSQTINTFAGNGYGAPGPGGFSGDGGQATVAELSLPTGVAIDILGNLYITDNLNNRIRKVNTSGIISTFSGNGTGSFSGDGGYATAAELYDPTGIAVDVFGNIYIADFNNNRVRIVNTSGIINTLAGNGIASFSGDAGPATAAELKGPGGLEIDSFGNVYIADTYNGRVRKVNTSGTINTFAGNGTLGFSGDGGQATAAELWEPASVTIDASGNVYIADQYNSRIRIVNTSGVINTFAGISVNGFSGDGGPASTAELYYPAGVALDAFGNVYISDESNARVRIVNTSSVINTFAGDGIQGFSGDGGQATAGELDHPYGVTLDALGNLYIGDEGNNRVRKINGIPTSFNEVRFSFNEVTIYPIPTTSSFTITGITQDQTIELYNYIGKRLSSTVVNNTTMQMDISDNANGIYLVRILNKDGSVFATKKIVKTE